VKENAALLSVPTPPPPRPAPTSQERHSAIAPVPTPVSELPADGSNGTENSNAQEPEGYNFPMLTILMLVKVACNSLCDCLSCLFFS